jgi:hypothetical protein
MPHEAVCQRDSDPNSDYLALALLDTRRASTIHLLNQALGCGCDPNVDLVTGFLENPCGQSTWELWLHVQYLYSQQHSRPARGDGAHQSMGATKDIDCQRIRENAYIIELLLRHGADPNCAPCTTDHHQLSEHICSPTALREILKSIVPADCLSRLQTLRVACSNEDRRSTLRRNQRKRAIRSYINSEQKFVSRVIDRCPQELQRYELEDWANSHWNKWRDQQRIFLQSLVFTKMIEVECRTCDFTGKFTGLTTWCLDCESRSHACLSCPYLHHLKKGAPCTSLSNFRITRPQRHTTITFIYSDTIYSYGQKPRWDLVHRCSARFNTAYQFLGCEPGVLDLTPQGAISVLKEWYVKNPIELDPLQGDDFQDIALPKELDIAALSINGPNTDEVSTSR